MSSLITNQCFLKAIDELNIGTRSVWWTDIIAAFKSLEIIVMPEPTDKESLIIWKKKKHKIEFNAKRIRKNCIKQRKASTDY